MAKVNLQIKGADVLIKRLEKFSGDLPDSVDEIVRINAGELADRARGYAPTRQKIRTDAQGREVERAGTLKNSISVVEIDKFVYGVGSNVFYAAYMEFGTGNFAASYVATLPPEVQAVASQYKANPRKRLVNIRPRPFLYPAYLDQIPILIDDLNNELSEI